jgi:endonuclease-3
MTATREEKNYARRIVRHLVKGYPDAKCALRYESPFQLLIATILSAQCTDARVNIVTEKLFDKYPTAFDLAAATQSQIERIVKSAGFFRSKAKNIRGATTVP